MKAATTARLCVAGAGIAAAALASQWAFGQKAEPVAAPAVATVSAPAAAPAAATDPLVERGRYLARAGDCVSCHTGPSNVPFAGGLPMKTPFGTIVSTNITPDKDAGIGNYTE
ncbi:MAG: cytochrome c, partial [Comamonadaceae bacterium]